jgi:hypothetical protein
MEDVEDVKEVEEIADEDSVVAESCLARKLASLGIRVMAYYTPRRTGGEQCATCELFPQKIFARNQTMKQDRPIAGPTFVPEIRTC